MIKQESYVPTVPKTEDEHWADLEAWCYVFQLGTRHYDADDPKAAKMLSVQLRQLLHDEKSGNVLENIGVDRTKLSFFSTPMGLSPFGLAWATGAVETPELRGEAQYFPLIDQFDAEFVRVDYETWWKGELKPLSGDPFSRRQIVLGMADKDGGAHIDKVLDAAYAKMKRHEDANYEIAIGGVTVAGPVYGREYAIVRQVAYEVQRTLDDYFKGKHPLNLTDPVHPKYRAPQRGGGPYLSPIRVGIGDGAYERQVLDNLIEAGLGESAEAQEIRSQLFWPITGLPIGKSKS